MQVCHGLVDLVVLELDVLVERALRAVGLAAGLRHAAVVALDLAGGPPLALLAVVAQPAVLDLAALLLRYVPSTSILAILSSRSARSVISSFICEVSTEFARNSLQNSW